LALKNGTYNSNSNKIISHCTCQNSVIQLEFLPAETEEIVQIDEP